VLIERRRGQVYLGQLAIAALPVPLSLLAVVAIFALGMPPLERFAPHWAGSFMERRSYGPAWK